MPSGLLATKQNHTHTALAESGQRLRLVEIRQRIDEAKILDLVIAMAQTGRALILNPETMAVEDVGELGEDTRQKFLAQLVNKIINNAVAPKELEDTTRSAAASWVADLESADPPESTAGPTMPPRAKMQPEAS